MRIPISGILSFGILAAHVADASPAGLGTKSDYDRAARLKTDTANKVYRDRIRPQWLPDGAKLWYRVRTGPDSHAFVFVDAEKENRAPAFDHVRLAKALKKAGVKQVRSDRLPLDNLKFDPTPSTVTFRCGGMTWRHDINSGALDPVHPKEIPGSDLTPESIPKASKRNGPETSVTVLNRTGGPVELFWVDAGGHRRSYGKVKAGGRHAQHTYAGHVWWVMDAKGGILAAFEAEEQPLTVEIDPGHKTVPPPSRRRPESRRRPSGNSPDGRWRAFIRNHNVWLKDLRTGDESPLTPDGTEDHGYGQLRWSPDSKKLAAIRTRRGEDHKVHFVESSPKGQVQPKLHTISYRKPGDRIPIEKPHLFDVGTRKTVPIPDTLFPNPWNLGDLRWDPDGSRFTFLYNQRGHEVQRLIAVDASTGKTCAVIDEPVKTFFDYAHKRFLHRIDGPDGTREILWMSERSGWNHLYRIDAESGTVLNAVTTGEWVVRAVDHVDEKARQVWFRAMGIRKGQDPYFVHHARVNFDGSGLVVLTEGNGTHRVEFSPDRRFFVDTWSRVDHPPVTELRRAKDGSLVCELERADWTALRKTGWRPPEPFVSRGRDGKTEIHGILIRPSTFDPSRTYPILEDIYAGPHGYHVPKAFGLQLRQRSLAELGFIVVMIDGMGTNWRSKAFHDVCWKNIADAGFPDRIAWMKAAAARHPELDLSRVGIFGGSAGGQNALGALLLHGDFYKAAAADCGCHDNRMDKIWWNELWMGWPVGPHYAEQSNVSLAHRLKGKLLLTVGELDNNVDPASTMQVVAALVKAGKDFELLVLPGVRHGAGEIPYAKRRRQDFFVRSLMGVESRSR